MSSASKQPTETKPNVSLQKHRIIWGLIAALVAIAFFSVWVMNNYGTPAKPGMPDPIAPTSN